MLKVVLFLALVGAVLSQDLDPLSSSTRKYGWAKISQKCFGEDRYNFYVKTLNQLIFDCKKEVYDTMKQGKDTGIQLNEASMEQLRGALRSIPSGQPAYSQSTVVKAHPFRQYQIRQKRQIYTSELMQKLVEKVKAKSAVFLCVLRKRDSIDANNNLIVDDIKANIRLYTAGLDQALVDGMDKVIDKCIAYSQCFEDRDSALPIEIQRILAYFKCDKRNRLQLCMKYDLLQNLDQFELTGLPEFALEDNAKVEKLLQLFEGADAGTEPLDLLT